MIILFLFGIVLGSFYNVVGYRLPTPESLIYPSSHCTTCNHKLGASELVPVFSDLFQKGKCKHCGAKISLFYPLFELTTGILFALSYYVYGLGDFLFKKESMGGGDIKLLFTFGLVFGWQMSIVSIFMASFIALPFAIYYTMKYKNQKYVEDDEIPENSIPF